MKRSVLAVSLSFLATVLAATGCGANPADKYIGEWHVTDNHGGFWVDLEIVRNGDTFLVIDNLGKQIGRIGRFEKRPATLENGMLKLGGACSIVYVEASGRLIASGCGRDTYEYERSR